VTKTPDNVPKALDAMADVVLGYKPKAKSKPAKKRKKRAAKLVGQGSSSGPNAAPTK
jgi:hypothetical protein